MGPNAGEVVQGFAVAIKLGNYIYKSKLFYLVVIYFLRNH